MSKYIYPKLAVARQRAQKYGADVQSSQRFPYKIKITYRGHTIHAGDRRYDDYLTTGDREKRRRYRARHAGDNLNDPFSSGFWSWRLLW